jgi:predicted PurR-regulated permease PerM
MLHESLHRLPRAVHFASTARTASPDPRRPAVLLLTAAFIVAAAITMWPFVASLVFAAWLAHLARPVFLRLRAATRREGAAALLTALLVVIVISPLAIAVAALVPAVKSLIEQLRLASGGKGVLAALVSAAPAPPTTGRGIVELAKEYGAGASKVLAMLASTSIDIVLGAFVFFAVFYGILVEGDRWWAWAREHALVDRPIVDRLADAFHEAGRGLIVGSGLTALIQGGLATTTYVALGVPRALLLGMLSVIAALIPMVGPIIVWLPVAAGLALTGNLVKATVLVAVGILIVGTVDNLVRPWLSRRFRVGIPMMIVLVAMVGGVMVFGGWGLFLGPLFVRLAGEMLSICGERKIMLARGRS